MKPFLHQAEFISTLAQVKSWALFWEQGTGKTKALLDNIQHLAGQGEINAALVLAPNGVHRAWIIDEAPLHMEMSYQGMFYDTGKAGTIKGQKELKEFLDKPFPLLAMSYDSFMTGKGRAYARRFLDKRNTMFILDESSAIKNAGAKRTRSVVAMGRHTNYRRVANGTPTSNSPFEVYPQIKFLDEDFWKRHGFSSFEVFKSYFGIYEKGFNHAQGREFKYIKGYQHIDELAKIVTEISTRILKEDALDLPPKLYTKRYVELSPRQRKYYNQIRDEYLLQYDSGVILTTELPIQRLLRLQQIVCGYLPEIDGEPKQLIELDNLPRLEVLEEQCDGLTHQAIIWAKFNVDVDLICGRLKSKAVRYDGKVTEDDRAKNKAAFLAGDAQFFVAKTAVAGKGHTFVNAKSVIYYSNSFSLEDRLHSEDRAHRAGQTDSVDYTDYVSPSTVDVFIVNTLRNKFDIASAVAGDALRDWI